MRSMCAHDGAEEGQTPTLDEEVVHDSVELLRRHSHRHVARVRADVDEERSRGADRDRDWGAELVSTAQRAVLVGASPSGSQMMSEPKNYPARLFVARGGPMPTPSWSRRIARSCTSDGVARMAMSGRKTSDARERSALRPAAHQSPLTRSGAPVALQQPGRVAVATRARSRRAR